MGDQFMSDSLSCYVDKYIFTITTNDSMNDLLNEED